MFERLTSKVRDVMNRMFGRESGGMPMMGTVITDEMAAEIDKWVALYYNRAPWLARNHLSFGLPSATAREIATLVTLEAKVSVGDSGADEDKLNTRAQFIADSLHPLLIRLTEQTEYACAFGGIAFRPYVDSGMIRIDFVNADRFYPTTFNARGEITGAYFVDKKRDGQYTYIRVEQHAMLSDGAYEITNRAFRSYGSSDAGTPISLKDVEEWADIAPEVKLQGITAPLFAYFRIPQGNVINVDSRLGVSVYARSERAGVLEEVDKQFQRLQWEYEGGEMAIDATVDAFKHDTRGNAVLPVGKERLFRVNEIDMSSSSEGKFSTYAPQLRDSSFADGLNRLLMLHEDLSGLARGTFSDANETVRTATELKISKQRTYATVTSIQMSLQAALDALAQAIDLIATLYSLAPAGEYEISYTWDDSIVVDAAAERESDRQDVLEGIMQAWEYRVKWYGETESQAKAGTEGVQSPVDKALESADTTGISE